MAWCVAIGQCHASTDVWTDERTVYLKAELAQHRVEVVQGVLNGFHHLRAVNIVRARRGAIYGRRISILPPNVVAVRICEGATGCEGMLGAFRDLVQARKKSPVKRKERSTHSGFLNMVSAAHGVCRRRRSAWRGEIAREAIRDAATKAKEPTQTETACLSSDVRHGYGEGGVNESKPCANDTNRRVLPWQGKRNIDASRALIFKLPASDSKPGNMYREYHAQQVTSRAVSSSSRPALRIPHAYRPTHKPLWPPIQNRGFQAVLRQRVLVAGRAVAV